MGGTTQTSGSTLGSWVLVDAKTGKQMVNPNNGHSGSIVCDLGTCGAQGSFGQEAAASCPNEPCAPQVPKSQTIEPE